MLIRVPNTTVKNRVMMKAAKAVAAKQKGAEKPLAV
jgi:hypothetical protein